MNFRLLLPIAAAVCLVPVFALANAPDEEPEPLIFDGTPVETCGWPTTVAVQGGGGLCTGTLVNPRVVTYAAHCGGGGKTVRFSEQTTAGKTVQADCVVNPGWNNSPGADWAYCVLPEAVDIPVTPIVYGCETDILQVGQEVAIAGFGNNQDGSGAGTKRWRTSNIGSISWASNTVGMFGYCQGDSGGPAFVKFPDPFNTWHVLSIVSVGICGGNGTHSLLPGAVPWIESDSGIDITPCFDGEDWAPTPQCSEFYAGDETGHGSWSDWCEGTPAGGSHATCGKPFDDEPDDTAPTVTITSPPNGMVYDDAPAMVDLKMEANDDGWGVRAVWLEINGDAQPEDTSPPYEFLGIPFNKGGYTMYAFAEDWAGNVGESEPVAFGVEEDPPDLPDPDPEETGTGDPTGTGTGPMQDGGESGEESGCGCATDSSPSGAVGGLFIGLLALRRRRRAR